MTSLGDLNSTYLVFRNTLLGPDRLGKILFCYVLQHTAAIQIKKERKKDFSRHHELLKWATVCTVFKH